jgi:hypothetical protein
MLFRKKDEATKLVVVIKREQQELAKLGKELASAQVKWIDAHRGCLALAACLPACPTVYTVPSEGFCQDFEKNLVVELQTAINARDSILGDLPRQIRELRGRINGRLQVIFSAFSGWSSQINDPELSEARQRAESLTDPAELISLIERETARIEDSDLPCALLKLDAAIIKALEVA